MEWKTSRFTTKIYCIIGPNKIYFESTRSTTCNISSSEFLGPTIDEEILSNDVAVSKRITSFDKNRMTTRLLTL